MTSLFAAALAAAIQGAGPGGIDAACPDETEIMDLAALDFDADGRRDLAVVCGPDGPATLGGTIALWRALDTGGFEPAGTRDPGDNPDEATTGDIDADGDIDLVVVAQGQHERTLAIFEQTGDGLASEPVTHSRGGYPTGGMALHDVDGDRVMDIVLTDVPMPHSAQALIQAEGEGIGPFRDGPVPGAGPDAQPFVADLVGNGIDDIAVLKEDESLILLAGSSDDRLELPLAGDADLYAVRAGGMVNADRLPDLLVSVRTGPNSAEPQLALSEGMELTLSGPLPGAGYLLQGHIASFDDDPATVEILAIERESARSDAPEGILYQYRDGEFSELGRLPLGGYPYAAKAIDFDGDGQAQLVIGDLETNQVRILSWPPAPDAAPPAEESAGGADAGGSAATGEARMCGTDQDCFENAFAACEPGATVTIRGTPAIHYRFEILGPEDEACAVTAGFTENPNPDFVGPSMVCRWDNAQAFDDVVRDLSACEGELVEMMTR